MSATDVKASFGAGAAGSAGRLRVEGQSFEKGAIYSWAEYSYKEQ